MYLYFLPTAPNPSSPSSDSASPIDSNQIQIPTPDGGLEHTTATFQPVSTWLSLANPEAYPPPSLSSANLAEKPKAEIILFPPQLYLLYLIAPFLSPSSAVSDISLQRQALVDFITNPNEKPTWGDKCISPLQRGAVGEGGERRSVAYLDSPGIPELVKEGRRGDGERIVFVEFAKEGPRRVEVRMRDEWEREVEQRKGKEKL